MTFLNTFILAGLAAVSIPIIIHLFNRRKARVIEWVPCSSCLIR